MSGPLIAFVTLIYLAVAVSEYAAGRSGMALTFANIGLIWNIYQ